jgi:DNA-binding NtrC family response regulator
MYNILVVDDEKNQLELLKDLLEFEGYNVFTALNINDAIMEMRKNSIDLVISDYKLKEGTGEDLLEKVLFFYPDTVFIMLTAFGTIETAVNCMKQGAFGFLTKPVNIEQLKETIIKALENKVIKAENKNLKDIISSNIPQSEIIGSSAKLMEIKSVINKVADLDVPVLIEGETGTGKELIAKSIHFDSFRKNSPFIAVNMAGIPENLIESELFGHEKGSFTGAIKDKKGKFELAGKGTIFLDEIGEMNIELQSKLLRVLQENEIQKVGSEKNIKIECRVVAATNRNLKDEIKKGTFREDLYYRLNLIKIDLPSLKSRMDDLSELIIFFVHKYARKYRLSNENIEIYPKIIAKKYSHYSFPGNIRELENIVERFLIFPESADMIVAHDSTEKPIDGDFLYAGKTLEEIEKEAIAETLRYCNGNKTQAAKMLNISSRGIRYKLDALNIK